MVHRLAPGRVYYVTDAMAAATRGDGRYRPGDVVVDVDGPRARRSDGTPAGSALTLDQLFATPSTGVVPLAAALAAASTVPARLTARGGVDGLVAGARRHHRLR